MSSLARAVAIQRYYRVTDYAAALAALDPPATDEEKGYLRDMVRRQRAQAQAKATQAARARDRARPVWETRHA